MKTALLVTTLSALVLSMWAIILALPVTQVKVDCSMASFHPDYTNAMRKACQERFLK